MSISSEINRISANVSDTLSAISEMGGTVSEGATSDNMAAGVRSIPVGAAIDDTASSTSTTYSSSKIEAVVSDLNEAIDAKGDPTDEQVRDAVNAFLEANPGAIGTSVYIGPTKPTDGTRYWLDTSGNEEIDPVVYGVTLNLTHVTSDNSATTATEGSSYSAAIAAEDGYAMQSVSVTMGGVDVTGTVYSNGNIYISSVTGDIVITAEAIEQASGVTTYTITNNLINCSTSNSALSVEENAAYSATITPSDGYTLTGATVSVTMGGVDVTGTVYSNGVITIAAVTGDIVITATAVEEVVTDTGIDLSESNIIASKVYEIASKNLAISSKSTTPSWDDFMALDVEKVYFYNEPDTRYRKTINIGGSFTPGWGAVSFANNVTIGQAQTGAYSFITNAWDKFDAYGYVVFEIDVPSLQAAVREKYDDGTLDATKEKIINFANSQSCKSGSTLYLLYRFNG